MLVVAQRGVDVGLAGFGAETERFLLSFGGLSPDLEELLGFLTEDGDLEGFAVAELGDVQVTPLVTAAAVALFRNVAWKRVPQVALFLLRWTLSTLAMEYGLDKTRIK